MWLDFQSQVLSSFVEKIDGENHFDKISFLCFLNSIYWLHIPSVIHCSMKCFIVQLKKKQLLFLKFNFWKILSRFGFRIADKNWGDRAQVYSLFPKWISVQFNLIIPCRLVHLSCWLGQLTLPFWNICYGLLHLQDSFQLVWNLLHQDNGL